MSNNPSVSPSRENVIDYQGKEGIFESHYYKLNKTFLSAVAMWPSPNTWFKRIKRITLLCVYVFCLTLQLAPFVTNEYSIDLFIEIISFIIPSIVFLVKFLTFFLNPHKLTRIFENMQRDWQSFEKQIELNILKQYAADGRRYTVTFALTVYVGIVMFTLALLTPDFLDLIIPLNKTREHNFPFTIKHVIDEEKYFHFILFNTVTVLVVGLTVLIASGTLLVVFFQHALSLFRITSYRMEHVFDNVASDSYSVDNNYRNKIIEAVNLHTRAIKYIEHCMDVFLVSYDIIAILGIASLSINLFRLVRSIYQFNIFLVYFMYFCGSYSYLFIIVYQCQELMNHSGNVVTDIYNSQWYSAPVTLQKYLLLIMRRSMKHVHIVLGGIFIPSLEGFTTLTNMSISYFMVMYTTRT